MSIQAGICHTIANVLRNAVVGIPGVTVAVEDSCSPADVIEKSLARFGVLALVAVRGHRRKPGTGESTAGNLSIEVVIIENPKHNRKGGGTVPTVTTVAELVKDALHWKTVAGRRIIYVDMQRMDQSDEDYRMTVDFDVPVALDAKHPVSWGLGETTVIGEVTSKTVTRAGVNAYETGRNGNVLHVGTRDRHWEIDLVCTVTTQDEDDLPETGSEFNYGGRTYIVDRATLYANAEDTSTVRLTGRTI